MPAKTTEAKSVPISGRPVAGAPCHNCHRRRLKCDRSTPTCLKCSRKGEECLGYQQLFRWQQGVASRGHMIGKTFTANSGSHTLGSQRFRAPVTQAREQRLTFQMADPVMQDLGPVSRKYMHYFISDVCTNLVLYNTVEHNRFRDFLPITQQEPIILHVMIAISALHMSNRLQNPSPVVGIDAASIIGSESRVAYIDALAARQKALAMLRTAIENVDKTDIDVVLAAILLFVQLELLDTGRSRWKYHVEGAKTLIHSLRYSKEETWTPLRRFLVTNCLTYDALGSSLSTYGSNPDVSPARPPLLLQDADGNQCSSFPAALLNIMRSAARISMLHCTSFEAPTHLASLIQEVQDFSPATWAESLQPCSPIPDKASRTTVASAHRAAVLIYLSRLSVSSDPDNHASSDLEHLVSEVINHVSNIQVDDPLFTAIAWPAFIAGAETKTAASQAWAAGIFRQLWAVEPWGVIRQASDTLESIWAKRKTMEQGIDSDTNTDWLMELRNSGIELLVA